VKLYALNTPCWSDYDPNNTAGSSLISDPLSDHFTFMFYNLMKFGLVDEVSIFLEEKRVKRGILKETLDTDAGSMKIFSISDVDNLDLEKDQYVYSWSRWQECEKLSNNFVIVNPMFSGRNYESVFTPEVHDYALIEGSVYSDTAPDWMPFSVFRYTTKDFCDITNKDRDNDSRFYDWIMVSSFDPRKRHIEFLMEMIKNPETKKMKGCIVGRNPDNKGYKNDAHRVLAVINNLIKTHDLDIDIFLNINQEIKKDLMLSSKAFVCASSLDNGPRAMIEATQAGIPLISMPHIGSADLIEPGITGELVMNFKIFPEAVLHVNEKQNQYDRHKNANMLQPSNVYPSLINTLKERKNG